MRIDAKPIGPFGIPMAPVWLAISNLLNYFAAYAIGCVTNGVLGGEATGGASLALTTVVIAFAAVFCRTKSAASLEAFVATHDCAQRDRAPWINSILVAALIAAVDAYVLPDVFASPLFPAQIFAVLVLGVSFLWIEECFGALARMSDATFSRGLFGLPEARGAAAPMLGEIEARRLAAKAYSRALARCPAMRRNARLVRSMPLAPCLYIVSLSLLAASPDGLAWRDRWIEVSAPVTALIAALAPGLDGVATELTRRGFAARVPFIVNALAFAWLLLALQFAVAVGRLKPMRAPLRDAFDAYRQEYRRWRPDGLQIWWRLGWLLLFAFLLFLPGLGASQNATYLAYDLAKGDVGLLVPKLLSIAVWWLCLYAVAIRFLALIARIEQRRAARHPPSTPDEPPPSGT